MLLARSLFEWSVRVQPRLLMGSKRTIKEYKVN